MTEAWLDDLPGEPKGEVDPSQACSNTTAPIHGKLMIWPL